MLWWRLSWGNIQEGKEAVLAMQQQQQQQQAGSSLLEARKDRLELARGHWAQHYLAQRIGGPKCEQSIQASSQSPGHSFHPALAPGASFLFYTS